MAGNGKKGFGGDGKKATDAQLNCPMSVHPAIYGGFYIADSGNYRIRKVLKDGTITTVAGNGSDKIDEDGKHGTKTNLSMVV